MVNEVLVKINLVQLAEDLFINVPKGTVIYDNLTNEELIDCTDENTDYPNRKRWRGWPW
jgi:GTPase involved in cell partitioning and DNA repair